jgi:hypothetical protein
MSPKLAMEVARPHLLDQALCHILDSHSGLTIISNLPHISNCDTEAIGVRRCYLLLCLNKNGQAIRLLLANARM